MQLTHAVGEVAGADCEHGHREVLGLVEHVAPPQGQEPFKIEPEPGRHLAQVAFDEVRAEAVDARRHGRVGRKHV